MTPDEMMARSEELANGDSNDAEIDGLREMLEEAVEQLRILEAFKKRAAKWQVARVEIMDREEMSSSWCNDIQWSDDEGCQIVEDLAHITKGDT